MSEPRPQVDAAPAAGAPASILIVDDHADLRESLTEILEDEGYVVASAANGLEGLEYLRAHAPPRLILLDLKMPVMDGWEFRRRQQADPALAAIPVAVVSGADTTEQRRSSLEAAFYLVKPVNLVSLLDVVARYCG